MLRRLLVPIALAAATACVTTGPNPEAGAKKNVGLTVHGGKTFLDEDWGSLDEQRSGGLSFDWGKRGDGLLLEVGFQGSKQQTLVRTVTPSGAAIGVSFEGRTREGYIGARYETTLWDDRIVPYIGAGGSVTRGSIESSPQPIGGPNDIPDKVQNSETWFVPYAHVGFRVPVGWDIEIGLDYRAQFGADYDFGVNYQGAEIPQGNFSGDYQQLSLTLGIGF